MPKPNDFSWRAMRCHQEQLAPALSDASYARCVTTYTPIVQRRRYCWLIPYPHRSLRRDGLTVEKLKHCSVLSAVVAITLRSKCC
ncbi:MAG: hypothetical protein K0U41_05330 [Gammaproteobacteria bacterium]|nr:hypothetical protein [Gammaproteobacteria bacterium]